MKILFVSLAILSALSSCASTSARTIASEWRSLLTCDDGLRIDSDGRGQFQFVLFGDAARHFSDLGAYDSSAINGDGEYVRAAQSRMRNYVATLTNGRLESYSVIDRSNPRYSIAWVPASNSGAHEADYVFNRCH